MATAVTASEQALVPPQNLDAEESVLGAMMLSPGAIGAVTEELDAGDFYRESHAKIYRAALGLFASGEPVDAITVADELEERGDLEAAGGRLRIHELARLVPTTANAAHYARIVREMAVLRGLIHAGGEVARLGWERPGDAADLLDRAEGIIFELSQEQVSSEFTHIEELLKESFERITQLYEAGEEITGMPSGYRDLDRLTSGFQPGNLIIVAARPSMGKSALALCMAANLAVRRQIPVALFTLEMSKAEVTQRLMCSEAKVESQRLRSGKLATDDWPRLTAACDKLAKAPIYVDDTGSMTIMGIRAKARRLKSKEPTLGLIVVDYLQLMSSDSNYENRVQEVSQISRQLKILARELDLPIIAMSQLSRAVEQRHDKRPILSDLRESGCLTGESRVFLPDEGTYRPIADLLGQEGTRVLALNEKTWQFEPRRIVRAFSTGRKRVFRLRTRLGRSVRATGNHRFLAFDGWRRLDELAPGTRIASPRRLPSAAIPTMSDAELALLGHLIGDGCTLPRHAVQHTTREHELAEVVSVPAAVFAQPASGIATFLRHLWATDGCLRAGGVYPGVRYDSSSERLSRDVQSLLLRLGINARLAAVSMGDKGRTSHRVTVSGKHEIERFLRIVGAIGDRRRREQAAILTRLDGLSANTNRDVVPKEAWDTVVRPAMAAAGVTTRRLHSRIGTAYCGSTLYRSSLSRERALVVAEAVDSEELSRLALSAVYWDEVATIEPDGEEEVFDLTVEGLHNFVGEDIVVHNSLEQDADLVAFIYRDEYYNDESPDQGLAEVILSKHRNGPTGNVKLSFLQRYAKFADLAAA
jgi:replicative DNA helicase